MSRLATELRCPGCGGPAASIDYCGDCDNLLEQCARMGGFTYWVTNEGDQSVRIETKKFREISDLVVVRSRMSGELHDL